MPARPLASLLAVQDRLFDWLERRPAHRVLFAVGWSLAFLVTLLAIVTPTYKVTDNTAIITMLRAGTEAPFLSQVFGAVFRLLYTGVSDAVPWFGLANYAALGFAMALFIHALASLPRARPAFGLVVALFSLLCVTFVIRCGYNASSMLLAGISVLAFAIYASAGRATRGAVLWCAFGLVVGFLFRPRGAQGAVAVILPALVAIGALRRDRYSLATLLLFAMPIGVVFTVETVWRSAFVSQEFEDFREFNKLRGKFHAYPIAAANLDNRRILQANGWEPYHYRLFKDWFFFDERAWNLRTVSNIFEYSEPLPSDQVSGDDFGRAFDYLAPRYAHYATLLVVLAFVLALFGSRRVVLWCAAYVGFLLVLAIYMKIALRFPIRVGDPICTLAFCCCVTILVSDPPAAARWSRRVRLGLGVGLAVSLLLSSVVIGRLFVHGAIYTAARNARYEERIANFDKWFDGAVVFAQPAIMSHHDRNPLRSYSLAFEIVPSGWSTFSPLFYDFLRRHGMERGEELVRYAVDNPDFYFMFRGDRLAPIVFYIAKDHGIRTKLLTYNGLSERNKLVFRLVTDPEPPEELGLINRDRIVTSYDRPKGVRWADIGDAPANQQDR